MANWNFDCPHCGRAQTVTDREESSGSIHFQTSETALGQIAVTGISIRCANEGCRQPTVTVSVRRWEVNSNGRYWVDDGEILRKRLIPESAAKPQPQYIPAPLREDYIEACRIVHLSPKAAATLARRCLQGMIRDFCGIKKGRLIDEIHELMKLVNDDQAPKNVSDDSVRAIDSVRTIGNIGAHMEKDINTIIEVDQDEAQILIELIETLFDEWYIEREKRRARFFRISEIATAKDEQKRLVQTAPKSSGTPNSD